MSYEDRTLTCQDCSQEFTFSADDQQYHAEKGYTNEPKRCPLCRARRRSGGGNGGGYSTEKREMHPANGAQWGQQKPIALLPSGVRPVYCSDCFSKQPSAPRRY